MAKEKDYVWVCEKCKDTNYSSCIPKNKKCVCCGGQYLRTDKDRKEWNELYDKIHPKIKGKIVTVGEVNAFITDTFLDGSDTVDQNLVDARIEALDELGDYLEFLGSKPHCPKCGSTNLGKTKRGFKWGRAIATAAVTGFVDVAAAAGGVGSNKMINCCNDCGHTWE